jgi:hypothetical protein
VRERKESTQALPLERAKDSAEGAGGEVAGIPVGVFSSQLARRRPVNATKMNGCVFILKISTHGCWRYSRGKEEENSEFRSQNFGLRI